MRARAVFLSVLLCLTLTTRDAHARKRKATVAEVIEGRIDEALVRPPADEEVCFSPDEPCDIKLLKFVDSAKESLDIAIYDINLDQLIHHLLLKAKQIPVRIVVDRRQAKGSHSGVKTLLQGGIELKYGHQRGIMHNKFVIVDGRALETGSFNHTHHAATANNENQIYLFKSAIVSRYRKRFEKLWAEGDR